MVVGYICPADGVRLKSVSVVCKCVFVIRIELNHSFSSLNVLVACERSLVTASQHGGDSNEAGRAGLLEKIDCRMEREPFGHL